MSEEQRLAAEASDDERERPASPTALGGAGSTRQVKNTKLYDALGVAPDATQTEIKKAFYKQSLKWHPDKNRDDPGAPERFQEINSAFQILSDDKKRAQYDVTGSDELLDNPLKKVDCKIFFAVFFATSKFSEYVGDLAVANTIDTVMGNMETAAEKTEQHRRFHEAQRPRAASAGDAEQEAVEAAQAKLQRKLDAMRECVEEAKAVAANDAEGRQRAAAKLDAAKQEIEDAKAELAAKVAAQPSLPALEKEHAELQAKLSKLRKREAEGHHVARAEVEALEQSIARAQRRIDKRKLEAEQERFEQEAMHHAMRDADKVQKRRQRWRVAKLSIKLTALLDAVVRDAGDVARALEEARAAWQRELRQASHGDQEALLAKTIAKAYHSHVLALHPEASRGTRAVRALRYKASNAARSVGALASVGKTLLRAKVMQATHEALEQRAREKEAHKKEQPAAEPDAADQEPLAASSAVVLKELEAKPELNGQFAIIAHDPASDDRALLSDRERRVRVNVVNAHEATADGGATIGAELAVRRKNMDVISHGHSASEEEKEMEELFTRNLPQFVRTLWSLAVLDIVHTLRDVVARVLKDKDASGELRARRARALVALSEAMAAAADEYLPTRAAGAKMDKTRKEQERAELKRRLEEAFVFMASGGDAEDAKEFFTTKSEGAQASASPAGAGAGGAAPQPQETE